MSMSLSSTREGGKSRQGMCEPRRGYSRLVLRLVLCLPINVNKTTINLLQRLDTYLEGLANVVNLSIQHVRRKNDVNLSNVLWAMTVHPDRVQGEDFTAMHA